MVMTGRASKFPPWVLIFLLSFPALLFADHLAAAIPSKPAKKVLLLYSYQSMLPGNLEWDAGIRSALKGTTSEPLEFYTEFLDLARFPENSYLQNLINFLQNKYAGRKIDLLIPVRDPAFQFLLAHGDAIFPGVPIVFCAAAMPRAQSPKRLENTTGVTFWIDVKGTLAAALKLHPQTRQVAVVGGTAKPDRVFQQVAQEALRQYEGRIEVISLTDLPLTEILQRVAKLPPHTIILYLCMFRDSAGNDFLPQNALALVAQAANAPIYGLWETLLGHGIVGGHLMSFEAQGIMAGKLGRRVLNGEKPENIPIVNEGANFYMFDWRQLQRWGIREKDLPPGSEVRFKEPSLWEVHHLSIIGLSAAFCLLVLLIMVLLINLERRRRAERELAGLNEELEQRVKERTADLEFANRELEAFSYSVSHDLKAPLRAIEGFSRMLAGEHALRLDEEGQRLLDVICDNTQIMSKLIDDLLALSRLGRRQIKKSVNDLAAMVGQVFTLLHDAEPEREVQLTVQPVLPRPGVILPCSTR